MSIAQKTLIVAGFNLLILYSQAAFANTVAIDQAIIESQRLQQAQEERRKALENQLKKSVKQPSEFYVETPISEHHESTVCFEVDQIEIVNVNLIQPEKLQILIDKYSKECINSKKIAELMSDLTQVYFEEGYVAARVYLPAQQIKESRKLILSVDEGVVTQLIATPRAQNTISIKTAAPFLVKKPLNLRDLEQALDQFNRLQSNNVTMQIQPGSGVGESVVVFDNEPTKRFSGYFSYDNKGQDITGRKQASVGVSIDNIFGLNDLLSLSYNRSLPFEKEKKDSEALSAFYVVPFGYHTASLSASHSNYDTTIITPFQALHSTGETESYSLKVDSLIYRDRLTQLRTNVGLTTKENKAYLEDVLLGVSSRKLTVAEVGLSYNTNIDNHFLNTYINYQKGLSSLNALKDEQNLDKEFPKAQFDKFLYGISYVKPFEIAKQRLMFSSNFSGQYSLDPLYGSEQYSIGSLYTVRGFNQKTISGDRGYSLKNDLSLMKSHQLNNGVLTGKYYMGLDYGKVDNKYGAELVGELSSVSIGSTFNFQNVMLDFLVTQPISQPRFLEKKEADFFFTTSFTF